MKCKSRKSKQKIIIIIRKLQKEVRKNVKTIEHLNESFSSAKVKIAPITESHDQISARSFELEKEIKSLKKKQLKLEKNEDLVEADFMKSEFLIDTMKNELLVREQEIKHLQVDNPNLSKAIQKESFTDIIKSGKKYSPQIRSLYYTLLAEQIPPKKIKQIIQYVLSTFFPDIDISSLQLPGESCAGYMRREELTTVSNAHKATALMQDIDSGKMLHINTDGTTKDKKS